MTLWVADTAPLIFLAKLKRLDLLQRGADKVITAPAVLREVEAYRDEAAESIAEATREWLHVRSPVNATAVELLLVELDLGEAEAIVVARETTADRLVLDDLDARRYARRISVPVVGTLGLLLAAKLRGEIPQLRPELEKLVSVGFRIRQQLIDDMLNAAGEQVRDDRGREPSPD